MRPNVEVGKWHVLLDLGEVMIRSQGLHRIERYKLGSTSRVSCNVIISGTFISVAAHFAILCLWSDWDVEAG